MAIHNKTPQCPSCNDTGYCNNCYGNGCLSEGDCKEGCCATPCRSCQGSGECQDCIKSPAQKAEEALGKATLWNAKHPIGTAVTITSGVNVGTRTTTKSAAMVFAKNEAVIFIHGLVGFINLDKLTVA